jgi:ABC-type cobalamin/Fe3+-siderophores transport system ATPase subunit
MAQSNLDDGIPQVTLVVLGAQGVGKSTFIQNSFDLRSPSPSAIAIQKMSLDDVVYLVRLVEMSLDAIVITESNRINWPKSLKGIEVPPVDGVLALYDVTNQQSISGIPDLLRWSPPFPVSSSVFCQLSPSSCSVPPAESYTPLCIMPSHASQHYTANKLSS